MHNAFGTSSFLFIAPAVYARAVRAPRGLQAALWAMPAASYAANAHPENELLATLDHGAICAIAGAYLASTGCRQAAGALALVGARELCSEGTLKQTAKLSFLVLNAVAFYRFSRQEWVIGAFALATGIAAKLTRDPARASYRPLTVVWHAACATLLYLATQNTTRRAHQ